MLGAVIGGPIGMTGYVMAVNYMGASIGAVASAIFPAIGAILAYFFLKEKMQWYRWLFLLATLLGVYGLSYSPDLNVSNFWLGIIGALMCAFGWGIEAVILAKCMQDPEVKDEYALQIRQTTSACVYGIIILPILQRLGLHDQPVHRPHRLAAAHHRDCRLLCDALLSVLLQGHLPHRSFQIHGSERDLRRMGHFLHRGHPARHQRADAHDHFLRSCCHCVQHSVCR